MPFSLLSRDRLISVKKEAALHPPVKLSPEEERAAKELIRKMIDEARFNF